MLVYSFLVTCALGILGFAAAGHPPSGGQAAVPSARQNIRTTAVETWRRLSNPSQWKLIGRTRLEFRTFHPQGLLKIGERFLLSSVEVFGGSERAVESESGTRAGIGHLFLFDGRGRLVRDLRIGTGDCFHPGGMDSDGNAAWVPVAEYRPDSRSVVYRLDLDSLALEEVFRVDDHIGGLVIDTDRVYGLSWGSRRFYTWDRTGHLLHKSNDHSGYIEYQDCKHIAPGLAACGGLNSFEGPRGNRFTLGGLEVVDFESGESLVQIPVPLYATDGSVMTRNPFDYELAKDSIRLYFVPEDDRSVLYEWEAPLDKR